MTLWWMVYAYNVNGNLTQDLNKAISAISYNILNLPQTITVANKGTIEYLYDAAGNKLKKTVNETGQAQKITKYVGGMIFENNLLQHVATEEGRVRIASGQWRYDYFLRDHLGNVRVMLSDNGDPLEETHYYPFGLTQKGISTQQSTASLQNKYKFNGIEESTDLGLNQYDAFFRTMDPQLGRFWQIDPRPSYWESPYVAMRNDPVYFSDPLGDTTINGQYYESNVNNGTLETVSVSSNPNGPRLSAITSTSLFAKPTILGGGMAASTITIGTGIFEGIGTGISAGASAVILPAVLVSAVILNFSDAHPVYMPMMPIGFTPADNLQFRPPNIIPPPYIPLPRDKDIIESLNSKILRVQEGGDEDKTFDEAREEAFKAAGIEDGDYDMGKASEKADPVTGTLTEFKNKTGAKVGYDSPHKSPGKHHDKNHISWQSAGKRQKDGMERGNIPYSGPRHPSRPARK